VVHLQQCCSDPLQCHLFGRFCWQVLKLIQIISCVQARKVYLAALFGFEEISHFGGGVCIGFLS
jgi:hypothetical protein